MTRRSARQRWWIALLYGLVAVASQAFHVHRGNDGAASHSTDKRPCGARGGHLDGGTEPDLHASGEVCPACQFQLGHLGWLDAPSGTAAAVASDQRPDLPPLLRSRPLLTRRGRAPPIA